MLAVLKSTGQTFCRMSPNLPDVFLMISQGLWVFLEKYYRSEVPCFSPHINISTWIFTGNINFDYLVKVVLTRFLNCEGIIFPFLYSTLWKLANNSSPPSKSGELNFWQGEYLHILLGILYGKWVSSPPFIYLLNTLYQHGLIYFFFILEAIIQYHVIYFVAQVVLI